MLRFKGSLDESRKPLDTEVDSEASSEVLFEQPYSQFNIEESQLNIEETEYSRLKRIKKRICDFLRDHYKTLLMIAALIIIIAISISIIIGLSIVIKVKDIELKTRVGKTEEQIATSVKPSESGIRTKSLNITLCDTINCTKANRNGCRFRDFGYATAMIYSCCGCLPSSMELVRFEELPLSHTFNLVLSIKGLDSQNVSLCDLKALKHLPYLSGSWNVVKESDSIYYLKYGGVELDPPVILEGSEVSDEGSESTTLSE